MYIDYDKFAYLLGAAESNNNYNEPPNRIGAMGRFQFMPGTLNNLQAAYDLPPWINSDNFVSNHALQDIYYKALVNDLLNTFAVNGVTNYVGTMLTDKQGTTAKINIYGLLAGGWLGGAGNVKKLLTQGIDHNDNPQDPERGTWISEYITRFSNDFNNNQNTIFAGLESNIILFLGLVAAAGIFF